MPSHDHCCVPLCTNRRNKSHGVSFHTFPRDAELRKKWISAIKIDEGPDFAITQHTVVCSAHFLRSDYVSRAPPVTATADVLPSPAAERRERSYHFLSRDAVPSSFAFKPACTRRPSPSERAATSAERWSDFLQRQEGNAIARFGPMTEA